MLYSQSQENQLQVNGMQLTLHFACMTSLICAGKRLPIRKACCAFGGMMTPGGITTVKPLCETSRIAETRSPICEDIFCTLSTYSSKIAEPPCAIIPNNIR
jgi:hypothetical protein